MQAGGRRFDPVILHHDLSGCKCCKVLWRDKPAGSDVLRRRLGFNCYNGGLGLLARSDRATTRFFGYVGVVPREFVVDLTRERQEDVNAVFVL